MIISNSLKEFFASFAVFPSEAPAEEGFAPFAVKKKYCWEFRILVISALLTIPLSSYPQYEKTSEQIVSIAEELAENEANEAVSVYLEQLYELAENPVNINSADEVEISRLFFLSDFQVKALVDHVNNTGRIVSVFEIAAIPGFDRHTAEMISPFIDLSVSDKKAPAVTRFHNSLLSNLLIKPGESDTTDIGSSIKSLTKYRFSAGKFSGAFTTEKDAGEKFFDFCSGNISLAGEGFLRKIIAGDYSARFGQGLNVNTGLRTGLLLTSQAYQSSRNEIRPYTSTGENNFFRGIAAQLSFKKTEIAFYFSHNKIDATIEASADSSIFYAETFYESGLHNSSSLIQKKDAVSETSFGTNVLFGFRNFKTGLCYSESRFSIPVMPDISDPVNLFSFSGTVNRTLSVHYSTIIKRMLLFGEFATNDLKNYAFVQGATLRPSDRLSINFLYRDYSPFFESFHGSGPGSSTSTSNEIGILGNFIFEAAKHLFISAGCDLSKSPWLRYGCSYPAYTRRTEVKLNYNPLENFDLLLTYNIRYKLIDSDDHSGIPGIEESSSHWLKGQVKYRIDDRLVLTTRADYKITDPSGSTGMLFLQDIVLTFRKIPVSLWARYCIFNTDDWESRIYTYENDLVQSFSVPALSGKGTRSYLMAKWEIGKMAELRIRYSVTALESGNNIDEKDDLKFQIRLWF